MSQLGDFLEILYGPGETFKTVQATARHWLNSEIAAKAQASRPPVIGRPKLTSQAKVPQISEAYLRIWLSLPDKVRVETTRQTDAVTETTIDVINGNRRMRRYYERHVEFE